jgi:hypothetical protein
MRSFLLKILCIALAIAVMAGAIISCLASDDQWFTCWVMCKPGSHVEVHRKPDKDSMVVGRLDPCDAFRTNGETKNGFLWCDVGEDTDGWVYVGYVSTEEPEQVFGRYVCVANKQVACRRWIYGPRIEGRMGWLKNMSTVEVFYRTSEWSVTSRGYIQSEWLDYDPE